MVILQPPLTDLAPLTIRTYILTYVGTGGWHMALLYYSCATLFTLVPSVHSVSCKPHAAMKCSPLAPPHNCAVGGRVLHCHVLLRHWAQVPPLQCLCSLTNEIRYVVTIFNWPLLKLFLSALSGLLPAGRDICLVNVYTRRLTCMRTPTHINTPQSLLCGRNPLSSNSPN